jgi:WD40 repeat protein
VRTLTLPRGHAYAVAYAADGRLLACGDARGLVHFWDLASFANRFVFEPPSVRPKVWAVAFSPGDDRLIVDRNLFDARPLTEALGRPGGAGVGPERLALPEVRLQEDDGLTALLPFASTELLCTPDGQAIVGRCGLMRPPVTLKRWGLDGRWQRVLTNPHWAHPLAFTADGRTLALAQVSAPGLAKSIATLALWDWASGAEVASLKHTDRIQRAAFTPDGRLLASAAGRTVRVWDVSSCECVARFPAFRGRAFGLAPHPRGRLLAAGSLDGTIRLWDLTTLREVERYDWQVGAIRCVAFAPDGMTAAAAGHKKAVVVWDVGEA